eukprot:COSAG02_NODE_58628_length_276_cov_6.898305_1_plen_90_part_01
MCSPTHSAGTLRITGNAGMNSVPRFFRFQHESEWDSEWNRVFKNVHPPSPAGPAEVVRKLANSKGFIARMYTITYIHLAVRASSPTYSV